MKPSYNQDDAYSWGQRTEADVDVMNSQMEYGRMGDYLPPSDGTRGMEDDHPNVENFDIRDGYLANKGLESFRPHDDCGTSVKPMYDQQAVYKGYGDKRYGK